MARFALCDYLASPHNTLVLMSSTTQQGLELRVWGEIKELFNLARRVWPAMPGYAVDSKFGIFTDDIRNDADDARDIRRGCVAIPVLDTQGQWKGLSRWVGVKQKRRRMLGDEVQFYPAPFLSTFANLNKGDFKGVFAGNPIGEGDPLDRIAEPLNGWDSLPDITATTTWPNKMEGTTIQLYGPDSPAIKHAPRYPYLINQADIDRIVSFYSADSSEYWNQAVGVRRPGVSARRVLTRDMVVKFGAQAPVVWRGDPLVKGYALDASYGGDRCVGGSFEFGKDIEGQTVIAFGWPRVIPVKQFARSVPEAERVLPEDQIAAAIRDDCRGLGIPAAHVFFDSTGRGSLGTSFARLWSADVNPVEFGGTPTRRPVCADLFTLDEQTGQRRLKRCDEHYRKFVTELWYSVRYVVEARQSRSLYQEYVDEFCAREWKLVRGDLIELETKEETKTRLGRSPDMADWASIAVEGARRLGFQIARLETPQPRDTGGGGWKRDLRDRARALRRSYTLDVAT
jgi:hypothetical protein